uniref:Uncharacterized protein n=1 Tax=Xiphophorus maculatus TaxID=8083 RepID=A0A3B5R1C5_XIPMA
MEKTNMMMKRRMHRLNTAGRDFLNANSSFLIPLALRMRRRIRPMRASRITRKRVWHFEKPNSQNEVNRLSDKSVHPRWEPS